MRVITLFAIGATAAFASTAGAQEIDWSKVDDAFGRKAAVVAGDVHRYGFPRTDLAVTLDGVAIKTAFALGGGIALKPAHCGGIAEGGLLPLGTRDNPANAQLGEGR